MSFSVPSASTLRGRGFAQRKLPLRLEALLALVGKADFLADVGTDHALLPAHAVLRGICQRAIGVDVREQPLLRASAGLELLGVKDRVTLVRGDGLAALAGTHVDAVVLAGLSGHTLLSWCRAAPDLLQRVKRLVVQPNGQLAELRAWAYATGLWLVDESICSARERFFVSCAFTPGSGPDPAYAMGELTLAEAFQLGPWLVRKRVAEAGLLYARESARIAKFASVARLPCAAELAAYEKGRRLVAG